MENRNRKLFLALRVVGIWRSTDDLVAHLHCSWGDSRVKPGDGPVIDPGWWGHHGILGLGDGCPGRGDDWGGRSVW